MKNALKKCMVTAIAITIMAGPANAYPPMPGMPPLPGPVVTGTGTTGGTGIPGPVGTGTGGSGGGIPIAEGAVCGYQSLVEGSNQKARCIIIGADGEKSTTEKICSGSNEDKQKCLDKAYDNCKKKCKEAGGVLIYGTAYAPITF